LEEVYLVTESNPFSNDAAKRWHPDLPGGVKGDALSDAMKELAKLIKAHAINLRFVVEEDEHAPGKPAVWQFKGRWFCRVRHVRPNYEGEGRPGAERKEAEMPGTSSGTSNSVGDPAPAGAPSAINEPDPETATLAKKFLDRALDNAAQDGATLSACSVLQMECVQRAKKLQNAGKLKRVEGIKIAAGIVGTFGDVKNESKLAACCAMLERELEEHADA
jgi:hypothetical protein